jgi:hypothetical protein
MRHVVAGKFFERSRPPPAARRNDGVPLIKKRRCAVHWVECGKYPGVAVRDDGRGKSAAAALIQAAVDLSGTWLNRERWGSIFTL